MGKPTAASALTRVALAFRPRASLRSLLLSPSIDHRSSSFSCTNKLTLFIEREGRPDASLFNGP